MLPFCVPPAKWRRTDGGPDGRAVQGNTHPCVFFFSNVPCFSHIALDSLLWKSHVLISYPPLLHVIACQGQSWTSRQQWKSTAQVSVLVHVSSVLPFQEQHQLQHGGSVTQVGKNGRGLVRFDMRQVCNSTLSQPRETLESWLCLFKRHTCFCQDSLWEALGSADKTNEWGFGHARHSPGRTRGWWRLPMKLSSEWRGCCGRNASVLENWYFC